MLHESRREAGTQAGQTVPTGSQIAITGGRQKDPQATGTLSALVVQGRRENRRKIRETKGRQKAKCAKRRKFLAANRLTKIWRKIVEKFGCLQINEQI